MRRQSKKSGGCSANHGCSNKAGAVLIEPQNSGEQCMQVDIDLESQKSAMALRLAKEGLSVLQCDDLFEGLAPHVRTRALRVSPVCRLPGNAGDWHVLAQTSLPASRARRMLYFAGEHGSCWP